MVTKQANNGIMKSLIDIGPQVDTLGMAPTDRLTVN